MCSLRVGRAHEHVEMTPLFTSPAGGGQRMPTYGAVGAAYRAQRAAEAVAAGRAQAQAPTQAGRAHGGRSLSTQHHPLPIAASTSGTMYEQLTAPIGPGVDALPVGAVVWAKIASFPWWPAQIQQPNPQQALLRHAAGDRFLVFYGK
jgi:hypothetical protein